MTALKDQLIKRIETTEPITLAAYMAECLMHPEHGYYQKEQVFGADGDFTTAPEVSQMFGEMIGLWLADRWIKMDRPPHVNLIELGPGRGTLMSDILRATEPVTDFQDAINVHFVETSAQLRVLQKDRVPNAHWHDTLADVPEGPALVIANEFFDALPIHQFEKRDSQWFERLVGTEDGALGFTLGPCGPQFALADEKLRDAPDGSILEVCPAALSIVGEITARLNGEGGAALIIDYGYRKQATGDSFQAMQNHAYVDAFAQPGAADLTAHVNFEALKTAASQKMGKNYGPTTQGMFLMAIGLGARAQVLAGAGDKMQQQQILDALKRLTAPDEMGTLFKVMAIQPHELAPPPGF